MRALYIVVWMTSILSAGKIEIPVYEEGVYLQNRERRISSAPYISGDSFRFICDFCVDEMGGEIDPSLITNGDSIFVHSGYLDFFQESVLPQIDKQFVLVTHNHIMAIPGKYTSLLEDKRLIKWYGINPEIRHPKIVAIPLGLANYNWNHGDFRAVQKVANSSINQEHLLYLNFSLATHPSRARVWELFSEFPGTFKTSSSSFENYLNELKRCMFVVSPRGSGEDCHRIWETLYVGSIPIVQSSFLDPLFDDLPVVIVDDFALVTVEFLVEKYGEFQEKDFHLDKLYIDYWKGLIHSHKSLGGVVKALDDEGEDVNDGWGPAKAFVVDDA